MMNGNSLGLGLGLDRNNLKGNGGSAFDPSSLSLDLDLRTPNYALNAATRASNGLITFNDPPTEADPDIASYIDQSGNGYDFEFSSVSSMAHWENTELTSDHDGLDDEALDTNGFLTAHGADTQGEFVVVFEDDEGTGNAIIPFSINNNPNNRILPWIDGSDLFKPRMKTSGSNNDINFSSGAETRSGRNTMFFSSNDTAYGGELNGVIKSVLSGTNNGKWMGDFSVAANNFSIGGGDGIGFYAFGFRALMYRSTPFTAQERIDLKTWLDANV